MASKLSPSADEIEQLLKAHEEACQSIIKKYEQLASENGEILEAVVEAIENIRDVAEEASAALAEQSARNTIELEEQIGELMQSGERLLASMEAWQSNMDRKKPDQTI